MARHDKTHDKYAMGAIDADEVMPMARSSVVVSICVCVLMHMGGSE